jgi:glycopeptide antibiotics resistance protein
MLLKAITILWGLTILWLSLYPFEVDSHGIKLFPHTDKLVHFGMHGLLAFLLTLNLQPDRWRSKKVLQISFFTVLYGTVIEVCQALMALGRSFDLLDIMANTLGIFAGLTGYFLLKKGWLSGLNKN